MLLQRIKKVGESYWTIIKQWVKNLSRRVWDRAITGEFHVSNFIILPNKTIQLSLFFCLFVSAFIRTDRPQKMICHEADIECSHSKLCYTYDRIPRQLGRQPQNEKEDAERRRELILFQLLSWRSCTGVPPISTLWSLELCLHNFARKMYLPCLDNPYDLWHGRPERGQPCLKPLPLWSYRSTNPQRQDTSPLMGARTFIQEGHSCDKRNQGCLCLTKSACRRVSTNFIHGWTIVSSVVVYLVRRPNSDASAIKSRNAVHAQR